MSGDEARRMHAQAVFLGQTLDLRVPLRWQGRAAPMILDFVLAGINAAAA
jgi:hypothetical protein